MIIVKIIWIWENTIEMRIRAIERIILIVDDFESRIRWILGIHENTEGS